MTTTVRIESSPVDAAIFFDGRMVGVTLQFIASISGIVDPASGMVVDFGGAKKKLEALCSVMDHKTVVPKREGEYGGGKVVLRPYGGKITLHIPVPEIYQTDCGSLCEPPAAPVLDLSMDIEYPLAKALGPSFSVMVRQRVLGSPGYCHFLPGHDKCGAFHGHGINVFCHGPDQWERIREIQQTLEGRLVLDLRKFCREPESGPAMLSCMDARGKSIFLTREGMENHVVCLTGPSTIENIVHHFKGKFTDADTIGITEGATNLCMVSGG